MSLTFERRYSALPLPKMVTRPGRGPTGAPIEVLAPADWDQAAVDILCSRYLDRNRRTLGRPHPEASAEDVAYRLAIAWTDHARQRGYFASPDDATAFRDEVAAMILLRVATPNSTQFFHTGTTHSEQGHGPGWVIGDDDVTPTHVDDVTGRPPSGPCTLLSPGTGLAGPDQDFSAGATGQWAVEAVTFVGGGGVGTNYSHLPPRDQARGTGMLPLMDGLQAADRAAGALAAVSRRRPARMVVVDADHPDIADFARCKADEEDKAAALAAAGYDISWTGPVYTDTLSYQNANHSVAVSRDLIDALDNDAPFSLHWPTKTTAAPGTEAVQAGETSARTLWNDLAYAAWRSADPGLLFTDTANAWHTTPTLGPIRSSDACSVYFQSDNTTSTLAALRLTAFWKPTRDGGMYFDAALFAHAVRIWIVVQDITQSMTWWPTRELAERTAQVRALGIGYCDLGGLLMRAGIAYDSDGGRAATAAITAAMHLTALATSAEMAAALGPAPAWEPNADTVARVVRNHVRAADPRLVDGDFEQLPVRPQTLDHDAVPGPFTDLFRTIDAAGAAALVATEPATQPASAHTPTGLRNLHVTCLQPTGTTGLFMGADSTALEPIFSLLTHKTLVDGSHMLLVADCVEDGLRRLGYTRDQIADVLRWIRGTRRFVPALPINPASLTAAVTSATLAVPAQARDIVATIERLLPTADNLRDAVTAAVKDVLGDSIGGSVSDAVARAFPDDAWELTNAVVCGRGTVLGAPHVDPGHYPVFQVAVGDNALAPAAHIRVCGAVAPFLSGSAAKTVNLSAEATVDDIADVHRLAHDLGTKCVAVYRDGAKLSQPLRPRPRARVADAGGCYPVAAVLELAATAGLREGEWVCAGSAPIAVRGLRVADDVDLVVSPGLFADLVEKYPVRTYPEDGNRYAVLTHPDLGEVSAVPHWRWGAYDPPVTDVLARAETLHGIPVLAWQDSTSWKSESRRPKDLADLELIASLYA